MKRSKRWCENCGSESGGGGKGPWGAESMQRMGWGVGVSGGGEGAKAGPAATWGSQPRGM
jgi:hypothetical protein